MLFGIAIAITGCATKERIEVAAQCRADAIRQFPPNIEKQLVNKTREIKVPTGNADCTTLGVAAGYMSCTATTRSEYITYAALEDVDTNASKRFNAQNECTNRVCYERYGNVDCKGESREPAAKPSNAQPLFNASPNMSCQTSSDCPGLLSCRSKAGGGTECR